MDSTWDEVTNKYGIDATFHDDDNESWFGFREDVVDSSHYDSSLTEVTFDVTSSIKRFVEDGVVNNGFFIETYSPRCEEIINQGSGDQGGTWTSWWSHEYNEVSKRPKLVIEYDTGSVTPVLQHSSKSISSNYSLLGRKLHFQGNSFKSIKIFSVRGVELFSKATAQNQITIPSTLAQGVYILTISDSKGNLQHAIQLP